MAVITPAMRRSALILLAVALPCGRLHAQLETITPGSRVRLTMRAPTEQRIRGELVARIRDSVAMQGAVERRFGRTGRTLPRAYPVSTLQRIDISVGRSPMAGAIRGATLGVLGAAGYGGIVWFFGKIDRGNGFYKQTTKVSGSKSAKEAAILLVPVGALIGALNAPDKWRRVYPPQ